MGDSYEKAHEEHRIVPYSTYVIVWVALLGLTALTVGAARVDLGRFGAHAAVSTIVALVIATVKASLVLAIFMGLRYERPLFRYMFLVTASTLSVFLILTYVDVLFR